MLPGFCPSNSKPTGELSSVPLSRRRRKLLHKLQLPKQDQGIAVEPNSSRACILRPAAGLERCSDQDRPRPRGKRRKLDRRSFFELVSTSLRLARTVIRTHHWQMIEWKLLFRNCTSRVRRQEEMTLLAHVRIDDSFNCAAPWLEHANDTREDLSKGCRLIKS
jgi:hypothetical protein